MKMKKNVVLLRVSSDLQDTAHQKLAIEEYLIEKNIFVKEEDFIEEDGVSGFKTKMEDRIGLMKIKEMALNNEIDKLVIFNLDRIGRRMELIGFINLLDECGVEILSVTEGCLNAGNDTDSLLNSVKMWLAEYDSKKKSEYVKNGKRKSALEGNNICGKPAFGYYLKDRKLYINKEESEIVKEIYLLYIKYGTSRTIDILRERGISKRDARWESNTVRRVLKNPVYIGHQRYKDQWLEYEERLRIIDDELFYTVQDLMKERRGNKGNTKKFINRSEALFEGVLYHKCGDGNIRKCVVDYQKNLKRPPRRIYKCNHCRSLKYENKKSYSEKKLIRELEPTILDLLDNLSVEDLEKEFNKNKSTDIDGISVRIYSTKDILKKKKKALFNATAELEKIFIGESSLDKETVSNMIFNLKKEVNTYENELFKLEVEKKEIEQLSEKSIKLIGKLKDFRYLYRVGSNLDRKNILQEFIDKIIIDGNNSQVEIKINIC